MSFGISDRIKKLFGQTSQMNDMGMSDDAAQVIDDTQQQNEALPNYTPPEAQSFKQPDLRIVDKPNVEDVATSSNETPIENAPWLTHEDAVRATGEEPLEGAPWLTQRDAEYGSEPSYFDTPQGGLSEAGRLRAQQVEDAINNGDVTPEADTNHPQDNLSATRNARQVSAQIRHSGTRGRRQPRVGD